MGKEGYVIWKRLAVKITFFPLKLWNTQNLNFLLRFEMEIGEFYPKTLLNQESIFCPTLSKILW